jgi:predicted SPOUT superfamily RNA methylase MTH1
MHEVDEIVAFIDSNHELQDPERSPTVMLSRILQYIESPPFLRKRLFPMHPDLKFCGLLPPLECPHHTRRDDASTYREGVVLDKLDPRGSDNSLVDVGLPKDLLLDRCLKEGTRVTVKLESPNKLGPSHKPITGQAVAPSEPTTKYGLYWGYQTRMANSFSEVFSGSPFEGGYDYMVGISNKSDVSVDSTDFALKPFKHMLLVLGGGSDDGIERCVTQDEDLKIQSNQTKTLFDLWVKVLPSTGQGCRTVRAEEEVMMTLTRLKPHFPK